MEIEKKNTVVYLFVLITQFVHGRVLTCAADCRKLVTFFLGAIFTPATMRCPRFPYLSDLYTIIWFFTYKILSFGMYSRLILIFSFQQVDTGSSRWWFGKIIKHECESFFLKSEGSDYFVLLHPFVSLTSSSSSS